MFSREILPPHLGGTSETYGGHPLNNKIIEGLELEKNETKIAKIDVEAKLEENVEIGVKEEKGEVNKVEKMMVKKDNNAEKRLMKRDQKRRAVKGMHAKNEVKDVNIGSAGDPEIEVSSDTDSDNGSSSPSNTVEHYVIVGDIDLAVVIDEPISIGEDRMNLSHTGGSLASGGVLTGGSGDISNLSIFNVAEEYGDAGI
jgi:hypothetical protein